MSIDLLPGRPAAATESHTLRVFLCDDTPGLRQAVRHAFAGEGNLSVVGEAADPVDGLPLIGQLQPDVVLLDLSMPRMDGFEALTQLPAVAPDAAVVVFSSFLSDSMASRALTLGADGYVDKCATLTDVAATVRAAAARRAAGERPAPPREPEVAAIVPQRALEGVRLPGDHIPGWALTTVSAATLALALALGALGVAPALLLVLFMPPVLAVAARGALLATALVALLTGAVYGLAGHLSADTDPVASGLGMLLAAGTVGAAIRWSRAWVLERAEHRAALTRELRRANAELDQFASVASHDLMAPLRTIGGFAALLERRYQGRLGPQADEYLGFITAGADRMRHTIDGLLAFARAGRVTPADEPFPLHGALDEARLNLAATIADRGAEVRHGDLPHVAGDERRIVQLLQNLLANAIKFCPPDRAPAITVSAVRVPAGWRIEVRDNGIGIDPRYASRVFGMFQRLHGEEEYPGTGIGLAVCQRIVERHGGRIWVDAPDGGGTLLAFTLPDASF